MLKIYLGDLVYDTINTNYVVPLNVAYIAAYVKQRYPGEVDITIFKYPKDLENALRTNPPDILGLSNYSWNTRLDVLFLKMAKRLNPNVVTVMGGPQIRTDPDGVQSYLKTNPDLDYYVLREGEEPFADLLFMQLLESPIESKIENYDYSDEGSQIILFPMEDKL